MEPSFLSYRSIFSVLESQCLYNLSICAIFQDEAAYLKEWIEYHRLLGVEHFYLYNNDSKDDYLAILGPYIKEGIVELINWPSPDGEINWVPRQVAAYNDCIERCQGITRWLAVIDIDEFIVPLDRPTIGAFLAEFDDRPHIGGVRINWQLFGTSWLKTIPKNKLLIESLILKGPWDYENRVDHVDNRSVKTIVRPVTVSRYRIHLAEYRSGFVAYPHEDTAFSEKISIDRIRIQHYWTRAEDFFYGVKIPRRMRVMEPKYEEFMHLKMWELNQIEDKTIFRFVEDLKMRLGFL